VTQAARDERQLRVVQLYRQTAKKEHASILRRRQIIEDRKEELEYMNTQRVSAFLTNVFARFSAVPCSNRTELCMVLRPTRQNRSFPSSIIALC